VPVAFQHVAGDLEVVVGSPSCLPVSGLHTLLMTRNEIAEATRREREKLVADLRTLSEEQWDTPSLCSDWRVRDVVGHLIRLWDYYRRMSFARDLIRYGFRVDHALSLTAQQIGRRPAQELLETLQEARYESTLVYRFHPQPLYALAEWIVHGQDIRRPLGMSATFDPEHLIAIGNVAQKWYTWGARKRQLSQRLEATDADFAIGHSQKTLRGPLEAVVMATFGRESRLEELVQ
jgi:uncharacterized protein (TIGR03083 family)